MERLDWVLLALLAAKGNRLQPVRLQKSLFLLGARVSGLGAPFYVFRSYHYGPFAKDIYGDADELERRGLVEVECAAGTNWREYCATSKGLERAQVVAKNVNPRAWSYLMRAVAWTEQLGFQDLVRSIYAHFPEYRENSVFQN